MMCTITRNPLIFWNLLANDWHPIMSSRITNMSRIHILIIFMSVSLLMVTSCSIAAVADRHLSAEVKEEWQELDELKPEQSSPADVAKRRDMLLEMVYQIVPYLMQHNAEAEACDVLMETERLDLLQQYVDRSAFPRVCLYLRRSIDWTLQLQCSKWQKCTLFDNEVLHPICDIMPRYAPVCMVCPHAMAYKPPAKWDGWTDCMVGP